MANTSPRIGRTLNVEMLSSAGGAAGGNNRQTFLPFDSLTLEQLLLLSWSCEQHALEAQEGIAQTNVAVVIQIFE